MGAKGKFNDLLGANACTACPAGRYSSAVGLTSALSCTPCSVGFYSDTSGATLASACRQCPAFTSTAADARTSPLDCQCISGYFLVNSTDMPSCKACPTGVECLDGFGEDLVPAPRPAYYLLPSTSTELVVTRCKVDRGAVCRGCGMYTRH